MYGSVCMAAHAHGVSGGGGGEHGHLLEPVGHCGDEQEQRGEHVCEDLQAVAHRVQQRRAEAPLLRVAVELAAVAAGPEDARHLAQRILQHPGRRGSQTFSG